MQRGFRWRVGGGWGLDREFEAACVWQRRLGRPTGGMSGARPGVLREGCLGLFLDQCWSFEDLSL